MVFLLSVTLTMGNLFSRKAKIYPTTVLYIHAGGAFGSVQEKITAKAGRCQLTGEKVWICNWTYKDKSGDVNEQSIVMPAEGFGNVPPKVEDVMRCLKSLRP